MMAVGCLRAADAAAPHACEIIGIRTCEAYDALMTVEWLEERAAGYPSLKRFEGGANWPAGGYDADELFRP